MKKRLIDFIKNQTSETYFNSLITRFILARELMYEYNDEIIKNSHIARNMTPFMNIYNIYLEQTNEDQFLQYTLAFPTSFSNIKDQYNNFLFGDPRLFTYKMKPEEKYNCTNGKVLSINKQNNSYAIYTIGIILFYIYFGYHPFLGKKYYESIQTDNEYNRIFFQSRPKFIFELNQNYDNNSNRFINGYHSKAFELWKILPDEQKNFWIYTFKRNFKTFQEFYENWQKTYGNFTITNMQTICHETLNVIMINEKTPLIISDNKISINTINCYKCNNNLINNCENCKITNDLCKFLNLKAKLTFKSTISDQDLTINLYPEKIIQIPSNKSLINLFQIVKSKKITNLLGLKVLTNKDTKAIFNNEEKVYHQDDIIPLFPNIKIIINDLINESSLIKIEIPTEGEKENE